MHGGRMWSKNGIYAIAVRDKTFLSDIRLNRLF